MVAPTAGVRRVMLERDQGRCASCGTDRGLEAQHRRAVGMGGSRTAPMLDDLLTLCSVHNAAVEGSLQTLALVHGWKVRRSVADPSAVPVFYGWEGRWRELTRNGMRVAISEVTAVRMMRSVYGDQWVGWVAAAGLQLGLTDSDLVDEVRASGWSV